MGASVFFAPLQGLLSYFQQDRHYRDDKKDAALLAIQTALIETRKYVEESGGDKCFDRDKEFRLSTLWAEAAIKARHVSNEMAQRLNDKSMYWSDQFEWSHEEVSSRQIDLDSIQDQVSALLRA